MSRPVALRHAGKPIAGALSLRAGAAVLELDGTRTEAQVKREGPWIEMRSGQGIVRAATARNARGIWVALEGRVYLFEVEHRHASSHAEEATGEVRAPMTGRVAAVEAVNGARVREDDLLLTIEAMKMEFKVTAPAGGAVEMLCAAGDKVELGQLLARIAADAPAADGGGTP